MVRATISMTRACRRDITANTKAPLITIETLSKVLLSDISSLTTLNFDPRFKEEASI